MQEDFQEDLDQQFEEVKPVVGQKSDQEHRLRLSVDIHSVKEQDFRGSIYAKYVSYPQLNISHFMTSPVLELTNAKVEGNFKNSFRSYTFVADKTKLYELFDTTNFEIELWHKDRLTKDILVGVTQVNFNSLLKAPLRKTSTSFARVEESLLPIDEIDNYRKPVRKVGLLRVFLYLEDLGPEDVLKLKEEQMGIDTKNQHKPMNVPDQHVITLPTQKIEQSDDPEKQRILNEMNSLEYKIIWELETWKKAEEAKFKIELKQKEMDFLQQLADQSKQKEIEKAKFFKQAEASIQLLERKIREKGLELQKRESKIMAVEDDLKNKIQNTAQEKLRQKEEFDIFKSKLQAEKANQTKEITALTMQLETSNKKLRDLQLEYDNFKKDSASQNNQSYKKQLDQRNLDMIQLQDKFQKENELKENYRETFKKLKEELTKQKKVFEDFKTKSQNEHNSQVQDLKEQILNLTITQQQAQKENMYPGQTYGQQQQLFQKKQQQQSQQPFQSDIKSQDDENNYSQLEQYPEYQWDKSDLNEVERLIQERNYLLQTGDYQEDDPLIVELNNQIAELKQV